MDVEVRQIIEDIRKFLYNREEEYKTNQFVLGMKYLFRGFAIRAQMGSNFNINQYTDYNSVLIKYCIEYYRLCWEHRNQILYNPEV